MLDAIFKELSKGKTKKETVSENDNIEMDGLELVDGSDIINSSESDLQWSLEDYNKLIKDRSDKLSEHREVKYSIMDKDDYLSVLNKYNFGDKISDKNYNDYVNDKNKLDLSDLSKYNLSEILPYNPVEKETLRGIEYDTIRLKPTIKNEDLVGRIYPKRVDTITFDKLERVIDTRLEDYRLVEVDNYKFSVIYLGKCRRFLEMNTFYANKVEKIGKENAVKLADAFRVLALDSYNNISTHKFISKKDLWENIKGGAYPLYLLDIYATAEAFIGMVANIIYGGDIYDDYMMLENPFTSGVMERETFLKELIPGYLELSISSLILNQYISWNSRNLEINNREIEIYLKVCFTVHLKDLLILNFSRFVLSLPNIYNLSEEDLLKIKKLIIKFAETYEEHISEYSKKKNKLNIRLDIYRDLFFKYCKTLGEKIMASIG